MWHKIRENWLNPSRKRFWGMVSLILYTSLGFLLVPLIVKNSIISFLHDEYNRTAQVELVEFNPYIFRLQVHGFELRDTDDETIASFDHFLINFQLSSLFRWAWTFNEIRLDDPYFLFERFKDNNSRLSQLLADGSSPADGSSAAEPQEEAGLPRFLINELTISNGKVLFKDNLPATPVKIMVEPIDLSVLELNTLPDVTGLHTVKLSLPQAGSLEWSGSFELAPFRSSGQLTLAGIKPDIAINYIEALLPLESIEAVISSSFEYKISQKANGEIGFDIEKLKIEVNDFAVQGLSPSSEFLSIPDMSIAGGSLHSSDQTAHFELLQISSPQFKLWLDKSGALNLEQLTVTSQGETSTSPAWSISLDNFLISDGSIDITDFGTSPEAQLDIRGLEFSLQKITNEENAHFPLTLSAGIAETGQVQVKAELGLLPKPSFVGNTSVASIPLSLAQPYMQEYLNVSIQDGSLSSNIDWLIEQDKSPTSTGSVHLVNLEISDGIENKRLLAFSGLGVDRFKLDLSTLQLHLSTLDIKEPYSRMVINSDKSTNVSRLIKESPDDTQAEQGDGSGSEPNLIIGGISIKNGSLDMSDFSLPLPFSTHVTELNGSVSTISTLSTEAAGLKLEGVVDQYGQARINGSMTVFDPTVSTDISLEFRNLKMNKLSPYTVDFVGRTIESGNLHLALSYGIDAGMLIGSNEVILSDLVLGEKIDHPDATQLPLGLAVALLTDSEGVIDMDLPVKGDVNDPEFEVGGVILKAFTQLITKIASAPFRLLGGLIGIDSDDLGEFEFLAGRSDLSPPELEKIEHLKKALEKRPELIIEVAGVTDSTIDIPALKISNLRTKITNLLDDDKIRGAEMMLDADIQVVLESLMLEQYPDTSLKALKELHTNPPLTKTDGRAIFDSLAYSAELRDRLLAAETISAQTLAQLGEARAHAIREAFLALGEIDDKRVVLAEVLQVESEDGQWVKLELSIATE